MSYEISGMSLGVESGKALPRNEARSGRSEAEGTARPEPQRLEAQSLKVADPAVDGRALEALAERAAEELSDAMESAQPYFRPDLEFKVDETSGRTVITVYHPETEEVIRQIPPEEAMRLAQILRESGENGDFSELSLIQAKA
ncbi:flagellar protein FlaG [Natronospira proteinivora]|uniref:Flagellar protein FlaG n=1 Tax=Natronospira proteinivora TaxID=1807133 RepID=A0ABT1G542_9GAMM|nr:flagellar protein FlaG [Natronospira proteinivora]MCP1726426.1 flagellar protein FlaG [Natronospira proteinivora]